jgi:hypothetical protein
MGRVVNVRKPNKRARRTVKPVWRTYVGNVATCFRCGLKRRSAWFLGGRTWCSKACLPGDLGGGAA